MLKEALKNYVQNNLNIYFKNLDILLDGKFLLEIETVIECTFNKNTKLISHSLIHKEISSTGNNNIVKIIGPEISSKIINETLNKFYKRIFDEEPKEVLLAFLKNRNSFTVLIYNCYSSYIKKVVVEKFKIIKSLNEIKKNHF